MLVLLRIQRKRALTGFPQEAAMARIPQGELERLKREVTVESLARARGVELAKVGKDLRGRCPFHAPDDDPSLSVDPVRNVFHCFGCGAKGSVVDWVMKAEGVSFRHAVEILRADNPSLATEATPPPKRSTVLKLAPVVTEQAGDAELRMRVARYYHETLGQSPEALEYLASRGLGAPELAERFLLGFANRTLGYRLPTRRTAEGQAVRARLAELGILKETGHELLRGSLVIPIFDAEGRVVQIYGRKTGHGLRPGVPKHLYLPGPRRGVFNLDALRESRELILCEALLDALTFWAAGFTNVTSAYGVNGFTDELLEAMKAYGTERLLIAYDRDERGDAAASKLAERLGREGLSCFRVRFPHGMDANEYALKVRPAAQSLGVLLRSAEYMSGPLKTLAAVPAPVKPSPGDPATKREMAPPPSPSPLAAAVVPPLRAESQAPPASSPVAPPALAAEVEAEVSEHEVVIVLEGRRWRVRGLQRNLSFETLKVNLLVASGERFHVDSLDLYSARQRGIFLKQAAEELQVKSDALKRDMGRVLLKLEQLQEAEIRRRLEPVEREVVIGEEDRRAALELLRDPKLLDRVSEAFETCGLVGEHTNKLVAYLATVSRKLERPLAVLVQSSSAAGKSALMEAVLALVPEEERVQYSAMTGQSLFYMGETDLKHKVLAIAEEEGAERASYALKLLQSEGKLSIASTGKDPATGRLVTHEYHVEGPSAILLTTTAIDLDEELLNRCLVLGVDESREQTRAIHRQQRESRTLEGLERRMARQDTVTLHQNAQRLLRPLFVVNPYACQLTFLDDTTRTRRDHEKYLALIDAIALVHQHQREVRSGVVLGRRVDYVEATLADVAVANRLAAETLGRTLDELPPQTRRLLFLRGDGARRWCSSGCKVESSSLTALHPPPGARVRPGGADPRAGRTSSAWSTMSTCSCTAAAAVRASSTSCCGDGRGPATASASCSACSTPVEWTLRPEASTPSRKRFDTP